MFIRYYQNHSLAFADTLQQTHAKWIAMDHTFKVSVNIGVERNEGVWVRLYDSLFEVVNEPGIVMEYRLVTGHAFENVVDLMSSIKSRCGMDEQELEMISVDNCCNWRRQLQNIFGTDVPVKLDLFHAVKRLSQVTGHNWHNPKRPQPKWPQTEMATNRNGHKPERPQTEMATNWNGHKLEWPQTEMAT